MKELYRNAEMEIVKFSIEDVITTSGDWSGDWNGGTMQPSESSNPR